MSSLLVRIPIRSWRVLALLIALPLASLPAAPELSAPHSGDIIPVTAPSVQSALSPYNWVCTDSYLLTTVNGASLTLGFKGTRKVILRVDLDQFRLSKNANIDAPVIAWSVNGGAFISHPLALDEKRVTLTTDITNPRIELYIKGMSPFGNRYEA